MIYCLDTDILIEYFRGNEAVKKRVENLGENDIIALTWLSVYEFFKGIFVGGKLDEEKFLKGFGRLSDGHGRNIRIGKNWW